jgi:hypothetical protein
MKKKPKSSPKKPQKATAKKPAPKKAAAKKPAPKKPVAKKPVMKKPAPKKVEPKTKPKPVKKEVKKVVIKAKPVPKKPEPKKPEPKKPEPAKAAVASRPMKGPSRLAPKGAHAQQPTAPPRPKRAPPAPRKRFVVLPPRPLVPSEVKDDIKNQKGLYKLEYVVYSSPDVLFEFLSSAGGLEKWFAPRVYLKDNIFVFSWGNDELKQANLLALREREFVRFRWLDQPEKRYFEFRMQIDDLTSEVALIVSDFADSEQEKTEAKRLWDAQIQDLLHALGSA